MSMKETKGNAVKGQTERVKYSVFSTGNSANGGKKGVLYARDARNCDCDDGNMKSGVGFLDDPALAGAYVAAMGEVYKILRYHYRTTGFVYQSRTLALTAAGVLYDVTTEVGAYEVRNFGRKTECFSVMDENGECYLVFYNAAGVWKYDKAASVTAIPIGKAPAYGAFFAERCFFAVEPFTLLFSSALSPFDFTESAAEGGYLHFPSDKGEIVGLAAVGEALLVFVRRGVFALTANRSAKDFELKEIAYGGGRILEGSMKSVGRKAFFLAEDGLYAFNGSEILALDKGILAFAPAVGTACKGFAVDGRYGLQYVDVNGNKQTLIVRADGASGYYAFSPEGVADEDGNAVCLDGIAVRKLGAGGVLPSVEMSYFYVENSFDDGERTLKNLRFKGSGEVRVTVRSERGEKIVSCVMENGEGTARVVLKGGRFTLFIHLMPSSEVREMEAEFCRLQGVD